jgi:hypothetical protein
LQGYLIFFDNSPLHPSILLNNILHNYLSIFRTKFPQEEERVVKIVLVKDQVSWSGTKSLEKSFYCEVVLTKSAILHEDLGKNEIRSVELANKKVSLKEQLDSLCIVESAADLNLKLMKWR